MIQKVQDGFLLIKPRTKEEVALIKQWRMFKENKKEGFWYAELSKTMLEKVKANGGLIPSALAELDKMEKVQKAVDYVRNLPIDKIPNVVNFPVRATPYAHQKRGAIMALLTFGVIQPEDVGIQ